MKPLMANLKKIYQAVTEDEAMNEIIEGLNWQFRKITKNKPSFTNDDSLRKILYLTSKNIVGHWSVTCQNRDMVLNQLSIIFGDRATA